MQPALDVEAADDFGMLLAALAEKPVPAPHEIERLRHALYQEGTVDRRLAAEIIHTNRKMRVCTGCWTEFYLEALTDFFLEYQNDSAILPIESENILLSWFGDVNTLTNLGERRLILRIFLRAGQVSERFERWVLSAIEENLISQAVRWNDGKPRCVGVIDVLDMQLIRRLIGGNGEHSCRTKSTIGIDFILNLDRNALQFVDPVRWRRILAECLARQISVGLPSGCKEWTMQDVDTLSALTKQLENRYSPAKAASLREDVLLARAWMMPVGQGG